MLQIEDYEPKKSLVISPAKMQRFYEDVGVPDEIYPWRSEPPNYIALDSVADAR